MHTKLHKLSNSSTFRTFKPSKLETFKLQPPDFQTFKPSSSNDLARDTIPKTPYTLLQTLRKPHETPDNPPQTLQKPSRNPTRLIKPLQNRRAILENPDCQPEHSFSRHRDRHQSCPLIAAPLGLVGLLSS